MKVLGIFWLLFTLFQVWVILILGNVSRASSNQRTDDPTYVPGPRNTHRTRTLIALYIRHHDLI